MKKQLFTVFSFILVLAMLLASTGTATAAPLGGGPSISAPSGGGTATLTIIPVAKLPGTEKNAAGTIYPQGHTSGDLQFGGNGVQVSGLVGYATLSLPLKNSAFGWTGSIYQYLDGAWVVLPTTINKIAESNDGTASATVYSDGIYALMVGYKKPAVAPAKCPSDYSMMVGAIPVDGGLILYQFLIYGSLNPSWLVEGETVNFRIVNISGDSGYMGPTSGNGLVLSAGPGPDDTYGGFVDMLDGEYYISWENLPSFTFRVYLGNCHFDATFPEDFVPVEPSVH